MSYSKTGKPISDLSYVKDEEGIIPTPTQFVQIRDIVNKERRDANFDVFDKEEVELIEEVLENISNKSSEIANYTKSLLAWAFAEYNEEIPFYTFQYAPREEGGQDPLLKNTIKQYLNGK